MGASGYVCQPRLRGSGVPSKPTCAPLYLAALVRFAERIGSRTSPRCSASAGRASIGCCNSVSRTYSAPRNAYQSHGGTRRCGRNQTGVRRTVGQNHAGTRRCGRNQTGVRRTVGQNHGGTRTPYQSHLRQSVQSALRQNLLHRERPMRSTSSRPWRSPQRPSRSLFCEPWCSLHLPSTPSLWESNRTVPIELQGCGIVARCPSLGSRA